MTSSICGAVIRTALDISGESRATVFFPLVGRPIAITDVAPETAWSDNAVVELSGLDRLLFPPAAPCFRIPDSGFGEGSPAKRALSREPNVNFPVALTSPLTSVDSCNVDGTADVSTSDAFAIFASTGSSSSFSSGVGAREDKVALNGVSDLV